MTLLVPTPAQRTIALGGTTVTVLASVGQTGGAYSLYRLHLGPRAGGAAPHRHRTFTESFTVLEGEVLLHDGEREVPAGPGDHLVVPPLGVHGFRNVADAPATLLMLSTPGVRREDYFAELRAVAGRSLSPEEWTALYARHDQEMVEPPSARGSGGAIRPT